MYKSKLQELCQKNKWELPKYTTGINVPCQVPLFTATVTVQGQAFETPEDFKSVKEAQNTAARIAYDHFNVPPPMAAPPPEMQPVFNQLPPPLPSSLPNPPPGNCFVACSNAGSYKNLLQEFVQKKGFLCPSYETVNSGMCHMPIFVSVVAIGPDTFRGDEAKTKKQAEMNAAKAAYLALTKVTNSSIVTTINECPVADNPSQNIQRTTTIRKHPDTSNEVMNSSMVSTINEYPVADNLSQNIQPTTTIIKHPDTTNEEPDLQAKRTKTSPENSASPAKLPMHLWKTVVIPNTTRQCPKMPL
ncbi:hypothetical protein ACS0TY_026511 [Phlomoides rotata]